MKFITPMTLAIVALTLATGLVGASNINLSLKLVLPSVFVVAIYYLIQLSLIPYDTYLRQLSTSKTFGWVSGIGKSLDELGFIIGMAATLPFVNGQITLWGNPGRIQAFVPTGLMFLVFSLPMLLMFKDHKSVKPPKVRFNFRSALESFTKLLKNRNSLFFLLAFYFFSDALLTIQSFFPIYFNQVYGLNDTQKVVLTASVLVFSAIGALIVGKTSDVIGKKKTLLACAAALCLAFAIIPLITEQKLIWVIYPVFGIFFGGFYGVARALLTHLSPPHQIGEIFSLFTIFRRFASVVGPLLWGLSVSFFSKYGPVNKYRLSIYPLVLMMIVGLVLLKRVREVSALSVQSS